MAPGDSAQWKQAFKLFAKNAAGGGAGSAAASDTTPRGQRSRASEAEAIEVSLASMMTRASISHRVDPLEVEESRDSLGELEDYSEAVEAAGARDRSRSSHRSLSSHRGGAKTRSPSTGWEPAPKPWQVSRTASRSSSNASLRAETREQSIARIRAESLQRQEMKRADEEVMRQLELESARQELVELGEKNEQLTETVGQLEADILTAEASLLEAREELAAAVAALERQKEDQAETDRAKAAAAAEFEEAQRRVEAAEAAEKAHQAALVEATTNHAKELQELSAEHQRQLDAAVAAKPKKKCCCVLM